MECIRGEGGRKDTHFLWPKVQSNFRLVYVQYVVKTLPNQQGTLNKRPSEFRCGDFVSTITLLSMQVGAKSAKDVRATELPFAHRRWWLGDC